MEYPGYIKKVMDLDFIGDERTADAAIKAVLGILVSRMDEEEARNLCENLPQPLSFDVLRGHQVRPVDISVDQYFIEVGNQFDLDYHQARELVLRVLHSVKTSVDPEVIEDLEDTLPSDWTRTLAQA